VGQSLRVLIVMAGLPGSGKSLISYGIAKALWAPVLSVDPIEAAMIRAGVDPAEPVGLAAYVVVEAVARDLLELGQSVIVDAVNAVEPARRMWRDLAEATDVPLRFIEVVCSDAQLHRTRLEGRDRGERAAHEPTWPEVERRQAEYERWRDARLVLDSVQPVEALVERALAYLHAKAAEEPAEPTASRRQR
jgi:predicted kinase